MQMPMPGIIRMLCNQDYNFEHAFHKKKSDLMFF